MGKSIQGMGAKTGVENLKKSIYLRPTKSCFGLGQSLRKIFVKYYFWQFGQAVKFGKVCWTSPRKTSELSVVLIRIWQFETRGPLEATRCPAGWPDYTFHKSPTLFYIFSCLRLLCMVKGQASIVVSILLGPLLTLHFGVDDKLVFQSFPRTYLS